MRFRAFLARLSSNRAVAGLMAAAAALGIALATFVLPTFVAAVLAFVVALVASWTGLTLLTARARERRRRRYEGLRVVRDRGEAQAIYDRETGLCRDWYFRLRLQEEVLRSERSGQPFALMLVQPGRRRLGPKPRAQLLNCMATAFHQSDLVGRLGDLRFGVLLISTDPEEARATRQLVLAGFRRGDIRVRVASYPIDGRDWRALLTAAGGSPEDIYGSIDAAWDPERASRFDKRPEIAA
jgi:GGDEF domain-containing protein